MIFLCVQTQPESIVFSPELWTAWATIALALLTIGLVIVGWFQLRSNQILNQVASAENTIIKQIEFHYKLHDRVNALSPGGKFAFKHVYLSFGEIYKKGKYAGSYKFDEIESQINDSFGDLYNSFDGAFGNYFKNLYSLVKYIHELPDRKEYRKSYYISLVKSQLSKYEILLLAYNCVWIRNKPQGENFIDFAKKYELLSALEADALIHASHGFLLKEKFGIEFE